MVEQKEQEGREEGIFPDGQTEGGAGDEEEDRSPDGVDEDFNGGLECGADRGGNRRMEGDGDISAGGSPEEDLFDEDEFEEGEGIFPDPPDGGLSAEAGLGEFIAFPGERMDVGVPLRGVHAMGVRIYAIVEDDAAIGGDQDEGMEESVVSEGPGGDDGRHGGQAEEEAEDEPGRFRQGEP